MSGIQKIINGELAQSKTKGKAFESEQAKKLSPAAIVKKNPCASK